MIEIETATRLSRRRTQNTRGDYINEKWDFEKPPDSPEIRDRGET